jgi:fructan beta-fructosidase
MFTFLSNYVNHDRNATGKLNFFDQDRNKFYYYIKKTVMRFSLNLIIILMALCSLKAHSQDIKMKITEPYLNIPLSYNAKMDTMTIIAGGKIRRQFPVQLAGDTINYWTYIDISEFKGQNVTISFPVPSKSMKLIYQDKKIKGSDTLYRESNRPQFHFTVKRGWSNDINGPVYYNNQYHMFWQSFPFGISWNTAWMYWGHAVSKDLIHWEELPHALMVDSLGSPWSGSSLIDWNNVAGFGQKALILFYTSYDGKTGKQVQCMAYSTDNAKTFQRYRGNPVLDTNSEVGSNDTRDPKVFWYEPGKHWVMVLFEKDGMSVFNSSDLKKWTRMSHLPGLWECPDFFQLPLNGNANETKWVLHGGSAEYLIGSFDGKTFTPETDKLRYAEGVADWGDILYAAQTFENMPDKRRVQIAWGRAIYHKGMPFTQIMLFPTEFNLKSTPDGPRMTAVPIREIEQLHSTTYNWESMGLKEANDKLGLIKPQPLHIKMEFTLEKGNSLKLYYQGGEILNITSYDLPAGRNNLEILIDKSVAEIFINKGDRYIVRYIRAEKPNDGLWFESDKYGPFINSLNVYSMKSIWN